LGKRCRKPPVRPFGKPSLNCRIPQFFFFARSVSTTLEPDAHTNSDEPVIPCGQTGVDRGALDAALVAGFACGGWCPAHRGAEDAKSLICSFAKNIALSMGSMPSECIDALVLTDNFKRMFTRRNQIVALIVGEANQVNAALFSEISNRL
jgi:hypothetical protein